MTQRHSQILIESILSKQAEVVLLEPRRVGKTTLACEIGISLCQKAIPLVDAMERLASQ